MLEVVSSHQGRIKKQTAPIIARLFRLAVNLASSQRVLVILFTVTFTAATNKLD